MLNATIPGFIEYQDSLMQNISTTSKSVEGSNRDNAYATIQKLKIASMYAKYGAAKQLSLIHI